MPTFFKIRLHLASLHRNIIDPLEKFAAANLFIYTQDGLNIG